MYPLELFPQPADRKLIQQKVRQDMKLLINTDLGVRFKSFLAANGPEMFNLVLVFRIMKIACKRQLVLSNKCTAIPGRYLHSVPDRYIYPQPYWKPNEWMNLKPCDIQETHMDTVAYIWLMATLCIPPHGKYVANHNRYRASVMLVWDGRFHLNMSFTHFSFTSHIWCYGDFVDIAHPFKPNEPMYVFCGKKHPWTIIYPSSAVRVKIIAKKFSNFILFYEITTQTLRGFSLCQLDSCQTSPCDLVNRGQYATRGAFMFFTHVLQYDMQIFKLVLLLAVKKYNYLELRGDLHGLDLFDGPTIESRLVASFHNRVRFSAFQATLVTTTEYLHDINLRSVIFSHVEHVGVNKTVTEPQMSYFKSNCFEPGCVEFQTLWLRPSPAKSLNVTVTSVETSGPREPRVTTDQYGAIGIYFVENDGEAYEVLTISYNLSKSKHSYKNSDSEKYHSVISRSSTEYVVIVFYHYRQYCVVTAEVLLSTTPCIGHFLLFTPCTFGKHVCLKREHCARHRNLDFRNNTKCAVVVLKNTFLTNLEFYYHFDQEKFSSSPRMKLCLYESARTSRRFKNIGISIYYPSDDKWLREIEYTVHNFFFDTSNDDKIILFQNFLGAVDIQARKEKPRSYTEDIKILNMTETKMSCQAHISKQNHKTTLAFRKRSMHLHYKLSTISDIPASGQDEILLYNDIHTLGNSWIVIRVHIFPCQLHRALFLPHYLWLFAWKTFCKSKAEPTLDTNIQANLTSDGYALKFPSFVSGINSILKSRQPKIAVYYGYNVIFRTHQGTSDTVYLAANLSDSGLLHIHHSDFGLSLPVEVPASSFSLPIPLMTLPRCYGEQTVLNKFNNPFCLLSRLCKPGHLYISLSQNLISQKDKFLILINQQNTRTKHNGQIQIHQICQAPSTECYATFISWNEAQKTCHKRAMYLPSVHSSEERNIIYNQIKQKECRDSYVKLHDANLKIQVMYQTIAIYIGINTKVRISCNLLWGFDSHLCGAGM